MSEKQFKSALGSTKDKTRKGRGNASGKGGQSGRGHKGQKSRSGYSSRAGFEGGQNPLYRRIPKRRGYGNTVFKDEYDVINVSLLNELYSENESVDRESLIQKGALSARASKKVGLKILGNGELSKPLTIRAHKFSKTAVEKIESAKGVAEVIS